MSHDTTRRTLTLAALAAALVFASTGHAQVETDPRYGEDPRDTPDPRDGEDPRDEAPDPREISPKFDEHIGTLLEGGHTYRAARDLALESWAVEPVVSKLVDRWLETLAVPEGQALTAGQIEKADDLRARGAQLAQLADQSLRDTRFMYWVETVHGWSAEDRAKYQEAEELRTLGETQLRSVASPNEALVTLTSFGQALARYRSLGDTRRIAELHATIGNIHAENGHVPEAADHLQRAEQMGREIKAATTIASTLKSYELLLANIGDYESLLDVLDRQIVFEVERGQGATAQRIFVKRMKLQGQIDGEFDVTIGIPSGGLDGR